MSFNIKTKKILSEDNCKRIIALGISLRDQLENAEKGLISDYDSTQTYTRGQAVYYDNYLYKCLYTTTGTWDSTKWQKIGDELDLITKQDIEAMLGLTQEEIETLQKIINDSQITLSTTFSSSRIYSDIQQSLRDSKTYTLEQLAKKTGATYKVVSGTDEITSSEYLYLISNGTVYDIYAFIDGNSQKIGDTTIDLSDYAKVSDLDNYYTKSDSDGKFATITTVNGKFDKANINTAISDAPSDEKVLSEKAIKSELDLKANDNEVIKRTDITTTIDSTSTDTQVPSAKSVFDNMQNKNTMQPSGTMAKYSTVFDWAVNNVGATCGYEGNNFTDCPLDILANTWGTLVCIGTKVESGLKVLFCTNFNKDIYTRTIQRRNGANEWVTSWQKVCTTSVADVPNTQISTNDAFTSTNDIQYSVSNGMCTLKVEATGISYTTDINYSWVKVTDDILPMPKMGIKFPLVCIPSGKSVVCTIDRNKKNLKVRGTIPSGTVEIYGSVSYPVAES